MNAELVNVFENWSKELSYRGTNLINRDEPGVKGYGFKNTIKMFISILNLDRFSLSFDIYITSSFTSTTLMYDDSNDSYILVEVGVITYRLYGSDYEIIIPNFSQNQLYNIKILRLYNDVYIYIDGNLEGSISGVTNDTHEIVYLISDNEATVANIKLNVYDSDLTKITTYNWLCNEGAGVIVKESGGYDSSAFCDVQFDESFDKVWESNDLFGNTVVSEVRGEILRLLKKGDDELIFELISNSELGLCFDISSPISREASFVNFNKAYERGVVKDISKYPICVNGSFNNQIIVYQGYLRFLVKSGGGYVGINSPLLSNTDWKTNDFYSPIGLIDFIPIPVCNISDDMLGYEISFVIKSSENIDLYFGILGYNADLLPVVGDVFVDHSSVGSNTFLNESSFYLCNGRDLLVRAVLSTSDLVDLSDKLNINLGTNLIMNKEVLRFIVPIISFRSVLDCNVDLKEIIIRPLEIDTQKGFIANKNKIFGVVKNNSGKFQDEVTSFIEEKLIPVNCDLTLKYL